MHEVNSGVSFIYAWVHTFMNAPFMNTPFMNTFTKTHFLMNFELASLM